MIIVNKDLVRWFGKAIAEAQGGYTGTPVYIEKEGIPVLEYACDFPEQFIVEHHTWQLGGQTIVPNPNQDVANKCSKEAFKLLELLQTETEVGLLD